MPDGLRKAIWLIASWALAFLFLVCALRAVRRKEPAQFWPWIHLKAGQLTSVPLYNQENATMWTLCALLFAINGIVGLFHQRFAAVLLAMYVFPGGWLLVRRYHRILRKYVRTEGQAPEAEREGKEAHEQDD